MYNFIYCIYIYIYIIYIYIYIIIMMKPQFKASDRDINVIHCTQCMYNPLMFDTCTVVCVCVSVLCLFPRNLGECFVLLLFEPIAGKNMSPSDKKLWRFKKKRLSCREIVV